MAAALSDAGGNSGDFFGFGGDGGGGGVGGGDGGGSADGMAGNLVRTKAAPNAEWGSVVLEQP